MVVIGLDPGTTKTGVWILDDETRKESWHEMPNDDVLAIIRAAPKGSLVAIERVDVGRFSGREVGQSIEWVGRFFECARLSGLRPVKVHRQAVLKRFGCNKVRKPDGSRMGNDAALRDRLIWFYGKCSVPKSSHGRSAMAVALVAMEQAVQEAETCQP